MTFAAISVREGSTLAAGGVSTWPGTVSSGVGAWAMAHGGVSICPGSGEPHASVLVSPAKAKRPSAKVKTTVLPSFLRFFMFFSKNFVGLCLRFYLETKKTKNVSKKTGGFQ